MNTIERLLEDFCRYPENNKVIDPDFIEHFILVYSKYLQLQEYVRNVNIKYGYGFEDLAIYDCDERYIEVYYDFLKSNAKQSVYCFSFYKSIGKYEKNYYQNIVMLSTLIHEICHADDNKLLLNGPYGLKTYFINAGYNLSGKCGKRTKDAAYYYCPAERFANIGAAERKKEFLEPISDELFRLGVVLNIDILENLVKGYDKDLVCPISKFFDIIHKRWFWKELDFYSDNGDELLRNVKDLYSLDERLRFGLPIAEGEYHYMNRLIKKERSRR